MAPRELEEHRALGARKFHGGEDLARPKVGLEEALEEVLRGDLPLGLGALKDQSGIQGQYHRRILGGRIGEREAAAQRAAIADRRVRDMLRRFGKERHALAHFARFLELGVRGERADAQAALRIEGDLGSIVNLFQVYQQFRQ